MISGLLPFLRKLTIGRIGTARPRVASPEAGHRRSAWAVFERVMPTRFNSPAIPLPCGAGDNGQVEDIKAIVAENRAHSARRFEFFPAVREIRCAPNDGFGRGRSRVYIRRGSFAGESM
jgi:hypothetical protein